jgi:hypothetical protein
VEETDMNSHNTDSSGLWKHVHGEAEATEAAELRTRAEADPTLRQELETRKQLDARFRHLLKVSAQSPEALEERIGELWEKGQAPAEAPATPERAEGRVWIFWRPALVALAASLMLIVGSITMSPEGLVWMAPGLGVGPARGAPGEEGRYYSEAELAGFAQTLRQSVAATYAEREGPSGWIARWSGRQRHVRPTLRPFPDGRILATLEAFRDPRGSPVGSWSESFANAEDFALNAGDWAGLVAEEIIADSSRRN